MTRASVSTPAAEAPAAAGGQRDRRYVVPLAFGTTVAMWAAGYLGRLSPELVPSWSLLAVMLVILTAGGLVAGRLTDDGWSAGARVGGVSSVLNLLGVALGVCAGLGALVLAAEV